MTNRARSPTATRPPTDGAALPGPAGSPSSSVDPRRSSFTALTNPQLLPDGELADWTLFTLVLGIVVWGVYFLWAMIHRFRIGWLERELRDLDLDQALLDRRAEAEAGRSR